MTPTTTAHAQYWPIGASARPMLITLADVSRFILSDWLPALPMSLSQSLIAWPSYVLESFIDGGLQYWGMNSRTARSERQWKAVLSWMMGVVGTRRVLAEDGYTWIAPASAFYPEGRAEVDTTNWHSEFPPSNLSLASDPANPSNLRPDYIAIRQTNDDDDSLELALVESKGTSDALASKAVCPSPWRDQVRNAIIRYNNALVRVDRFLVVATRCNPNAVRTRTRRIDVRAWNTTIKGAGAPSALRVEVAEAHLFGICRNLGLAANLRALEAARKLRASRDDSHDDHRQVVELTERADEELAGRARWRQGADAHVGIERGPVYISVRVCSATIDLIRLLRSTAAALEVERGLTSTESCASGRGA